MGCTPRLLCISSMRAALDDSLDDLMWKAALSTSFSGLMRGCEIAIDAARGEAFPPAQYLLVSDVRELPSSGRTRVVLRMRKRKDLSTGAPREARHGLPGRRWNLH